jgi:glycosyltransferase involved in cell wall biosynthesis
MVKLMLDGLQRVADEREAELRVFHVNAKLSSNLETIGKFQLGKVFRILLYCAQAYFHRFVNGADTFYYVPAPGLRAAVYRDWIVMFFCRPLFKKAIFHWHAAGLSEWLETNSKTWERRITHWLLDGVDLSIVLSEFARGNAESFSPRKIEVIQNGIPDPCENFEESLLPVRQVRFRSRKAGAQTHFAVLFMGACTAAKGLFAALDAIALINRQLAGTSKPLAIRFIVAGDFASEEERRRFQERIGEPDLNGTRGTSGNDSIISYKGFVEGAEKKQVLGEADCLCFPSLYPAEGQPVTILEALAFGLEVVATRWRGIPELLTGTSAQLIDGQDAGAIATALVAAMNADSALTNRRVFLDRYRVDKYVRRLTDALVMVD